MHFGTAITNCAGFKTTKTQIKPTFTTKPTIITLLAIVTFYGQITIAVGLVCNYCSDITFLCFAFLRSRCKRAVTKFLYLTALLCCKGNFAVFLEAFLLVRKFNAEDVEVEL
jgi:hypothetical protein